MTAKLSENMRRLLIESEPGRLVMHGPTRAALIRRGLVYRMDFPPSLAGRLTPVGIGERETLLAEISDASARAEIGEGSIVKLGRDGGYAWRVLETRRGFARIGGHALNPVVGTRWMPIEDLHPMEMQS